jgi:hypothetical protein
LVVSIPGILLIAVLAFAVDNKGAEQIELYGGDRGNVPFPHHQHQNIIQDCKTCHEVFPQEKGSIERLKADDQLNPKHVMNKLCTKCHREKKKAGEKSGPVTCKQCHIRTE